MALFIYIKKTFHHLDVTVKKQNLQHFVQVIWIPHDIYSYSGCIQLIVRLSEDAEIKFSYEFISKDVKSLFPQTCESFLRYINLPDKLFSRNNKKIERI